MNRLGNISAVAAAVFAVTALSGCSGGTQAARDVAESFAMAYFSADYETAAGLCSPELPAMVLGTGTVIDCLPAEALAVVMELSQGMQAYTGEVHAWTKDSVTVDFDIIYPGEIEPIKTALTVVREPGADVWRVVYAQERM